MYQSFTGTPKRARQVNLSGRQSSNPFAAASKGVNSAVASAQQEREERARQRQRSQAAEKIQRHFRGHASRIKSHDAWRVTWDLEEERCSEPYYATADVALRQLKRLLLFYSADGKDVSRLTWYAQKLVSTNDARDWTNHEWTAAYSRLLRATLQSLRVLDARKQGPGGLHVGMEDKSIIGDEQQIRELLRIAAWCSRRTKLGKRDALSYYETLTALRDPDKDALQIALLAPLRQSSEAHAGLAALLVRPCSTTTLGFLASGVDRTALFSGLQQLSLQDLSRRDRLWLLGNSIFLGGLWSATHSPVIARLLGSLAEEVDFECRAIAYDNEEFDRSILAQAQTASKLPLNSFLSQQITTLVEQDAVRGLLTYTPGQDSDIMASFALTLIRCFPRRADDLRMWMYLGPSSSESNIVAPWEASKQSKVFQMIRSDTRAVMSLLKPPQEADTDLYRDDWTAILLFLEIYSLLIRLMDDEEFTSADREGRKSQIPLDDVAALVTFLKNLAFTLYFNVALLNDANAIPAGRDAGSLSKYFGRSSPSDEISEAALSTLGRPSTLGGFPGMTFDYLRGLTTGLLRFIYERDSRLRFLPTGHWLMTSRFDMDGFIDGVVLEEEKRRALQYAEDDDETIDDPEADVHSSNMHQDRRALTGRTAVLRSQMERDRDQRKAMRRRFMESVAPRLEILQNLPFFIPFETRVEIFRDFVLLDQKRRRHGITDPDQWRAQMEEMAAGSDMQLSTPFHPLARHYAVVQRGREFADAFDAFYSLGEGFKEPIQIGFLDKWGNNEAGIDGGGVTKEFLTSVINQAFGQGSEAVEKSFFIENEDHLLYPNPTFIEDFKVFLTRESGLAEQSRELNARIEKVLQGFEFLGRIIGKCLYEGILVDVNFAGFFLKKWALTGGSGSAPMESGYRASINDLKDLDRGLYRNLLWLKTAPASELEGLGVTFTVDDHVGFGQHRKVIEHELEPGGADITVNAANRLIYMYRVAWYRLQGQSARQTNAFLKGLATMIHPNWLSMFNQSELQTLISGSKASIDVDDLRANTICSGLYEIGDDGIEHPTVQKFWHVMRNLDNEDRQLVLKFVTSTPRGPLLGFTHLNPKFSIRDSGTDENRLPSASTCVNLLKLPIYQSEQVLREKLLHAVRSGAGFDLS